MHERVLASADAENRLASILSVCPEVTRADDGEHKEAWALANAFSDFEKSFRTFLDEYLPRLNAGGLSPEEIRDTLLDVGELLRPVAYHIATLKFYSYLPSTVDD
jgi:hypothetical protein